MSAVDVVVPCYNYGRFLEGCVNSVVSQRDVNIRVLIIDDASSDNTLTIGMGLASKDTRVTFHRHEINQGLVNTANEGILDWARAPYTLLLSADDALTPGSLARATQVLDQHPEVGMVYGMAQIIGDGELPCNVSDASRPTYRILSGLRFLKWCCEYGNPVASPTAVVRTQLQQSTGGYYVKMPQTSDLEMWMRLATLSAIGVVRDTQAYYRWHGTNMSEQYYRGKLVALRERATTCEYVSAQWGRDVPEFDRLIKRMKRMLAERAVSAGAGVALENGDWEEYHNCIAFADEMNRLWRISPASLRLSLKRLLGGTTWCRLRQLGMRFGYFRTPSANKGDWDWRVGGTFGWWPTDH
jgi:glycosyltransferase involved in cell wall biosynthesis